MLTAINNNSGQPKYQQIVHSIIEGIEKGLLKKGQQLASINEMSAANKMARQTIVKAYAELQSRGIIEAKHGKGFYVTKIKARVRLNIFVLFDTFNAYKEILYASFKRALPQDTRFSIFFHHYDIRQFRQLISDHVGNYNYYVIMPHFDMDVSAILKTIPNDKLLLLDKNVEKFNNDCGAVYQDFEKDVYNGLYEGLQLIKKYKKVHLVFGKEHLQYVPAGILKGVTNFCRVNNIRPAFMDNLDEKKIKAAEAYLIFNDTDMVRFIKYCAAMKWKLGRDIGLISYDDTPLKEILLGGVTVITTDFALMGSTGGRLIAGRRMEKIANPSKLIKRTTL